MNIIVEWNNEAKTILMYDFHKGWSWSDLRDALDQGNAQLSSVEHKVDVIMNFTNAAMFAPSGAISQARHVTNNPRHENIGLTVVVGSNFIGGIFQVVSRIAVGSVGKWDVVFVRTVEEAYEKIRDHQDA